ncbi:MAG: hypothetical protein ACK5YW_10895 [Betaproteobacteria bacterium]|nr:hypothetical protein [Rhodocyclaceae bacterium]MCA3134227.1 hypothetical protein [Rhodocyclaceae bacterium]MCA3142176.1 hypothetical protein [Rhodocyclaceae bacterium]MCA3146767.1 hypothetical protein [Rhodocyclaceae bacterium]MCE2898393.1 hypothetical protein [Betaproteobacteria bacterium]
MSPPAAEIILAHGPWQEARMGLPREDWFNRHRYTVEDFYRMGAADTLAPVSRVELTTRARLVDTEVDLGGIL